MEENAEENGLSADYRTARKARTEGNLEEASKKFTRIVEEDAGCSEWSLKALKQLIKIDQAKNDEAALVRHYKRFLNDCGMGVCTDDVELSIRRILQRVSERQSLECARSCLEKTVDYFKESGDDLRWFKFAVLLSKHYLRMAEHVLFFPLVRELKEAVKAEKNAEKKAAMSVDLAILEVGYSTDHVPDALLAQSWYETARDGAATVRPLNPCTSAVIAEREGHAAFDGGRYWASQHNFLAAFKLLDGIRSEDALRLLKMVMIARALTNDEDGYLPEEAARRHGDHSEIVQTGELLRIWDTRPSHEFQAAAHSAKFALVGRGIDDFLQKFIAFGRRRLIARLVSEDDWIGILQCFPATKIAELASIIPMLPAVVDNSREHLPLRDIERVDIRYIKENLAFTYIRKLEMRCSNKNFPLACATLKNIGTLNVLVWPSARFDWRTLPDLQRCEKVTYFGKSEGLRHPERFIHAAVEKQVAALAIAGKLPGRYGPSVSVIGLQAFGRTRHIRAPKPPPLHLSSAIVLEFLFEEHTQRLKRKMHVPGIKRPRGFLRQLIQAHHASNLLEDIGLVVERGGRLARELAAYHRENPNQLERLNERAYFIRGAEMSLRFDAFDVTMSGHATVVIQRGATARLEPRRAAAPMDPDAPVDEIQALRDQLFDEPELWYDELMRDLVIGE